MENSKWYVEGRKAHAENASITVVCPYEKDTAEFWIWNEGFTFAALESYKVEE